MFGLLKTCTCRQSKEKRTLNRLSYCGTCKVIGSLYGQKARFVLNHDTAFLAELLLSLNLPAEKPTSALSSFNCAALPGLDEIPVELKISASLNLLLLEFKLIDQLEDAGGIVSAFAYRAYSENFDKASKILQELGFPIDEAFAWLKKQFGREREDKETVAFFAENFDRRKRILYFAESSSELTGRFFEQAAAACGLSHVAPEIGNIGRAFGALVYALDALEDYKEDLSKRQFNAIVSAYETKEQVLPSQAGREVAELIQEKLAEISVGLASLNLLPETFEMFKNRFYSNTHIRLSKLGLLRKHSARTPKLCSQEERSVPPSLKVFASKMALPYKSAGKNTFAGLIWIYAYILGFLIPVAIDEAENFQDCLEMPFNLILLSTMFQQFRRRLFVLTKPMFSAAGASLETEQFRFSLASSGEKDNNEERKDKSDCGDCASPCEDCSDCCSGCDRTCCDCSACNSCACDSSACNSCACDCSACACDSSACNSCACDCSACDCCSGCHCHS